MAFEDGLTVVTDATGPSDYITLRPGDHVLIVHWAGTPGDADLEVSGNGVDFVPAQDAAGPVNITSNYSVQVAGGVSYRLSVNSHTSAATFSAHSSTPRAKTDYQGR